MFRNGATTIWEGWDGEMKVNNRITVASQNHFALGSICGFLFRRVAGIAEAAPGFETIVVRPLLDSRLKRGGGDYDSIMGRISTAWSQEDNGSFHLRVTIPANATAFIHLPAGTGRAITENSRDIFDCEELRVLSCSKESVVVKVGSGSYDFIVGNASTEEF